MASDRLEQRRVWFAGQVQGVGFRYTTHELAQRFALNGTVRNLEDGRVELIAEGAVSEIDAMLAAVRERFDGFIREETSDRLSATGRPVGFEILR